MHVKFRSLLSEEFITKTAAEYVAAKCPVFHRRFFTWPL